MQEEAFRIFKSAKRHHAVLNDPRQRGREGVLPTLHELAEIKLALTVLPVQGDGQAIIGHGRSTGTGQLWLHISRLTRAVNILLTMFEHGSSVLSGHSVREGEAVAASSR